MYISISHTKVYYSDLRVVVVEPGPAQENFGSLAKWLKYFFLHISQVLKCGRFERLRLNANRQATVAFSTKSIKIGFQTNIIFFLIYKFKIMY